MGNKTQREVSTHTFDASSARSAAFYMALTMLAMAVGVWAAIAT